MPDTQMIQWDFSHDDIHWDGGRLMFKLWQAKAVGGTLPSREDFDPRDLVSTLPTVMLVDVEHEPLDFTVRLIGTDITHMMDRDPTGMRVIELRGGQGLFQRFEAATRRCSPYMVQDIPTPFPTEQYPTYSVLVLPLANKEGQVNMLIMNLHFGEEGT